MRLLPILLFVAITLSGCQLTKEFWQHRVSDCNRRPVIIAVIDTGFGRGWDNEESAHLCNFGHKNFANDNYTDEFFTTDPVPVDDHGHGTHIAGTIDRYAKTGGDNYCMIILKYYEEDAPSDANVRNSTRAIRYAAGLKVDFINYSGGGAISDDFERDAVEGFIKAGGTFVAAAGNEGLNLDYHSYYPGKYDGVVTVGANQANGKHWGTSNFGDKVKRWELGVNVVAYDRYMSGTSQAAAIATGKLVAEKNKSCK